jgi:hypothetical protein
MQSAYDKYPDLATGRNLPNPRAYAAGLFILTLYFELVIIR